MSVIQSPAGVMLRQISEPPNDSIAPSSEARAAFYSAMGAYIESGSYGFWLDPECEDGHCDPEAFVVTIGSRFSEFWSLSDDFKGSPIEAKLAAALLWVSVDWAGFPTFRAEFDEHDARSTNPNRVSFFITPQAKILGYRVDLLLWFSIGRKIGGIAVECDGHAFHEKTKEQAARDKRRDREILMCGFPVVRFSGSEIFHDGPGCAGQVAELLSPILHRITKDSGDVR